MVMPKKSAMPASANWLTNCQRARSSQAVVEVAQDGADG